MAEIFSEDYPGIKRFTLGGSDVLTEVVLPTWARRISVQFITNAGKITFEGSDGAAIGANYATVAADSWFELTLTLTGGKYTAKDSFFLASATGSTVVEVIMEA